MFELIVEKTFDSAHFLKGYDGDCARMHGHTYKVQICVAGTTLNELGMLMDFKEMKRELNIIIKRLDHQILNEVLDVNPTTELVAKYFYDELMGKTPTGVKLKKVILWENLSNCVVYSPD